MRNKGIHVSKFEIYMAQSMHGLVQGPKSDFLLIKFQKQVSKFKFIKFGYRFFETFLQQGDVFIQQQLNVNESQGLLLEEIRR